MNLFYIEARLEGNRKQAIKIVAGRGNSMCKGQWDWGAGGIAEKPLCRKG